MEELGIQDQALVLRPTCLPSVWTVENDNFSQSIRGNPLNKLAPI